MNPLLLVIPFALAVYAIGPEPQQNDAQQPPATTAATVTTVVTPAPVAYVPPVSDMGAIAFGTAKDHLNAGRLGSAAYYFEQAARHNYAASDAYEALAYIQYRLDNVEQGDRFLIQVGQDNPEREWADPAKRERLAAQERVKAREAAALAQLGGAQPAGKLAATTATPKPAAVPAPELGVVAVPAPGVGIAVVPVPKVAAIPVDKLPVTKGKKAPTSGAPMMVVEENPGLTMGVKGCAVLISAADGNGLRAAKALNGVAEVDCVATESGPAPKITTIWYGDETQALAQHIAATLPGGAQLRHAVDLSNQVEIRLGSSFRQPAANRRK